MESSRHASSRKRRRWPAAARLRGLAAALTPRDIDRLAGVHPDLVRVVIPARASVPFFVDHGRRTVAQQRALILAGKSRIKLENAHLGHHVTGHAVDLYPVSDKPVPQMQVRDFLELVNAMEAAARAERVPMEHGHDWGWDSPHHELARDAYS